MIKVIFFDFDGVLTVDKTGSQTTTRYLSQATSVELPRVQAAFARHNADLTLGRRTHASIWADICRDLGTDFDIKLLHEAFASTPINQPMLALARQLKLNYSVGMITDNKEDRIDCLKDLHGLGQLFYPIVVSASVGADKRHQEIFLHALSLVRAAPRRASASISTTAYGTLISHGSWAWRSYISTTIRTTWPRSFGSFKIGGSESAVRELPVIVCRIRGLHRSWFGRRSEFERRMAGMGRSEGTHV